jgi:hypothetical protein
MKRRTITCSRIRIDISLLALAPEPHSGLGILKLQFLQWKTYTPKSEPHLFVCRVPLRNHL